MKTPSESRKATCAVLEAIDSGVLSAEGVAAMCLDYMSEADVADMIRANDLWLPGYNTEEDETEESEEDEDEE